MSLEHLSEDEEVEIYGGVTRSWNYVSDLENPWFGRAVRTIDLPLTVIFDTLILPITIPVSLTR
jgi:uncharacterized protein YceK